MRGIITPKNYITYERIDNPVIFLGGPIGNAPKWHPEAIKLLFSKKSDLIIVDPSAWYGLEEEFKGLGIEGENIGEFLENNPDFLNKYIDEKRQRAWERYYLDIARKVGGILFWLPGEDKSRTGNYVEGKTYGAMTRIELGQELSKYNGRLAIGTDGNFPEFRTIEIDIKMDAPNLEVQNTLTDTCLQVLKLL
nr:hypothetical protein [Candidatus Gracilibacteria bacterium]